MIRTLVALSVFAGSILAQGRVAPENLYPRLLCVVPMIGTGTEADPRRPMFVPAPSVLMPQAPPASTTTSTTDPSAPVAPVRPPIFAFQFQLSDDGNYALLELVGVDKTAFASIRSAAVPGVALFDRDTATDAQIENEFKKHKSSFSMKTYVPVRVM